MALRRAGERLAVRPPDLAETLEPTVTGWQAHARPFAFEEELEYAPRSARFLTGTPNPAAHYAATAGYDLVEEIGVGRIREHSLRQTQLLLDLADEAGYEVTSPRDRRDEAGPSSSPCPSSRRCTPSSRSAASCATSGPTRDPARAALLHLRRRDPVRRRADRDILETGAYERHLGAVALH